jgi:hypothetical protein
MRIGDLEGARRTSTFSLARRDLVEPGTTN